MISFYLTSYPFFCRPHGSHARKVTVKQLLVIRHVSPKVAALHYFHSRLAEQRKWWVILCFLSGSLLSRDLVPTGRRATTRSVAQYFALSVVTIRTIIHRWNQVGPAANWCRDGRSRNRGKSKLTDKQWLALRTAVQKPPQRGGKWTGLTVAKLVKRRWGLTVRIETGVRWLRKLRPGG